MSAPPLTPDDLARMRAKHDLADATSGLGRMIGPVCVECRSTWPCDARRLLDEVERLRLGEKVLE